MSDNGKKTGEAGDPADKKSRALPDSMREAMLDQAASTLIAIHTAKQVGAQVLPTADGSGSPSPLTPNLRLPLGDVLFGIAQLHVDFARQLFEFNKKTSATLRDRLRNNPTRPPRTTIPISYPGLHTHDHNFNVKNSASLSKTLNFRAKVNSKEVIFNPVSVTVAAGEHGNFTATFPTLTQGDYPGEIVVESQGIRVDTLPFLLTVT